MKVVKHGLYNSILLTDDEIKNVCKIGQGAETCIWCCVGNNGFECLYYNKPVSLLNRLSRGDTVAKRDGCEEIRKLCLGNI